MKNILAAILGASMCIFIGYLFINKSMYENVEETIKEANTAKAFQIGAYNNESTAEEIAAKNDAIVINSNDLYLVYKSVLVNSNNIESMVSYLNKNNIYYYIKTIPVDDNYLKVSNEYENLMQSTKSDLAFLKLNKQILNTYKENYDAN